MTNSGLRDADKYVSLAKLQDQTGRFWGDAIAYVEHKVTEPKRGRVLYCWMRMIDVADRNQLLYGLFRFAGGRRVD